MISILLFRIIPYSISVFEKHYKRFKSIPFVKLLPKFNCGRTGDEQVFYCLCAINAYGHLLESRIFILYKCKLVGRILCSILNCKMDSFVQMVKGNTCSESSDSFIPYFKRRPCDVGGSVCFLRRIL